MAAHVAPPDKVRERLHRRLAEARAAERLTSGSARISLVPQMCLCPGLGQPDQLRLEFDEQPGRLEAA